MINYSEILGIHYPTSQWAINNEEYETLQWFSEDQKPTQAHLDALWTITQEERAKQECKKQAQELLNKTDWTTINDVADPTFSPYLINQQEFKQYRAIIRKYAVDPVVNPVFPSIPEEQWSK